MNVILEIPTKKFSTKVGFGENPPTLKLEIWNKKEVVSQKRFYLDPWDSSYLQQMVEKQVQFQEYLAISHVVMSMKFQPSSALAQEEAVTINFICME